MRASAAAPSAGYCRVFGVPDVSDRPQMACARRTQLSLRSLVGSAGRSSHRGASIRASIHPDGAAAEAMHTPPSARRTVKLMRTLLVVAATLCSSCSPSSESRRWEEDVELASGEVVRIERDQTWRLLYNASLQPDKTIKRAALRVLSNDAPPEWRSDLLPVLIERRRGERTWLIVATTFFCDTWVERGRPDPPYWVYQSEGSEWIRVTLPKDLVGRKFNIAPCASPCMDENLAIDWKRNPAGDQTPVFRSIVQSVPPMFCAMRRAS